MPGRIKLNSTVEPSRRQLMLMLVLVLMLVLRMRMILIKRTTLCQTLHKKTSFYEKN